MKLTDLGVRALAPPARGQKTYWDDTIKSFGCRVSQGGTKSFVLQYGFDRRLITIGRFPVICLADAREAARRILAEHTLGRHRPRSIRWDEALAPYLQACSEKNRPSTVETYRWILNRHFPFKRTQLASLTFEDIERQLAKIATSGQRNHALTAVKAFLGWCQKPPRRYIAHNPCEGMAPTKRKRRKRLLADPELAAIFKAAIEGTDTFSHIVALLVLMGQRRTETASLRRSWCVLEKHLITLPDHVTKNGREHTFPYGDLVHGVFERRHNLLGGDLLFPPYRSHVRGEPVIVCGGWSKHKKLFDARCGVTNWTLHDLRRTFATRLAELGVLPHVIERLLNHRMGAISNYTGGILSDVAEVYNLASYLPEMRAAVALWEDKLTRLLALSDLDASAIGPQTMTQAGRSTGIPLVESNLNAAR
jgi:integrase